MRAYKNIGNSVRTFIEKYYLPAMGVREHNCNLDFKTPKPPRTVYQLESHLWPEVAQYLMNCIIFECWLHISLLLHARFFVKQ